MMLLIRSMSTGELVFSSGSRCSPSPCSPSGISSSSGWSVRARVALHELLADQRLRPDRAAGVRVEGREARRRRSRATTAAFLSVGHVHLLDHADARAGDLHVLALDGGRDVVEDRAHLVARAAVAVVGAHAEDERRRHHAPRSARLWRACASSARGGVVAGRSRRAVLVAPRRRAVGRRLHRAARAALRLARLEPFEALARAGWRRAPGPTRRLGVRERR